MAASYIVREYPGVGSVQLLDLRHVDADGIDTMAELLQVMRHMGSNKVGVLTRGVESKLCHAGIVHCLQGWSVEGQAMDGTKPVIMWALAPEARQHVQPVIATSFSDDVEMVVLPLALMRKLVVV